MTILGSELNHNPDCCPGCILYKNHQLDFRINCKSQPLPWFQGSDCGFATLKSFSWDRLQISAGNRVGTREYFLKNRGQRSFRWLGIFNHWPRRSTQSLTSIVFLWSQIIFCWADCWPCCWSQINNQVNTKRSGQWKTIRSQQKIIRVQQWRLTMEANNDKVNNQVNNKGWKRFKVNEKQFRSIKLFSRWLKSLTSIQVNDRWPRKIFPGSDLCCDCFSQP